jgi:hypothetical protein
MKGRRYGISRSTDEWIKKMKHIYKMKYYSAIKKNEIKSFPGKWILVEIIMLRAKLKKPDITILLTCRV